MITREDAIKDIQDYEWCDYDDRYTCIAVVNELFDQQDELEEQIQCLKHNCEVKEEYNNNAYKNYKNIVEKLEQHIKSLEAQLDNTEQLTCIGCKYYDATMYVEYCDGCKRNENILDFYTKDTQ